MNQSQEFCAEDLGFHIDLRHSKSGTRIRLSGNLGNDAGVPMREAALQALAHGRPVQIDWASAEYLGVGSMQVLMALSAALPGPDARLTVCGDCGEIRTLLELAGLSSFFPVELETVRDE